MCFYPFVCFCIFFITANADKVALSHQLLDEEDATAEIFLSDEFADLHEHGFGIDCDEIGEYVELNFETWKINFSLNIQFFIMLFQVSCGKIAD